MYAIENGKQAINGVEVATFRRDVSVGDACLVAEAGTTGCSGSGCRMAGGRTFLRIGCVSGDFCFIPIVDKARGSIGIAIAGCGDDSLDSIVKALEFCLEALADQYTGVND